MIEQNTPERRRQLDEISQRDPSEKLGHMVLEIASGVAKRDSINIENAEDSRMWDLLAQDVAAIKRRGHMVMLDND